VFGNGVAHGIDLTLPTVNEDPGPTLAALRASVRQGARPSGGSNELERDVRARVPVEHRERFDDLLADARLLYRLRDERHLYGVLPSMGLARRAILELGARLVRRKVLPDAPLAMFAGTEELCALLGGAAQPDAAALERRRHTHATLDASKVPLQLGGPPGPPPPAEWLPNEGARRLMRAVALFFECSDIGAEAPAKAAVDEVRGLPVSNGTCEGTARLCASAADLARIVPGDVLVATTTSPAINVVLPILGAIVTDRGGALCHAAIVSREYGIPGVVGTRDATRRIPDGARVRVDGNHGTVAVLS
jgi:pyruvate,water dikinase